MHENAIYTCNFAKFVEIVGFLAELCVGYAVTKDASGDNLSIFWYLVSQPSLKKLVKLFSFILYVCIMDVGRDLLKALFLEHLLQKVVHIGERVQEKHQRA